MTATSSAHEHSGLDAADVVSTGGRLSLDDSDPIHIPIPLTGYQGNNVRPAREPAPPAVIEWRGFRQIMEPRKPLDWRSRELQIGPGRPAMIVGYGASLKTLAGQSFAMAAAAGRLAWGRFEIARSVVRHLDHEQGSYATERRYQRLALGMGVLQDDDIDLACVSFPPLDLADDEAADAYARACEGADLVLIDSLRAATPGVDENSSDIRRCLDVLTRASEKTGITFLVIHHAGKAMDAPDARTSARGSSAIYDAAGNVLRFDLFRKDELNGPRKITQAKQPAEAEGEVVAPFLLRVEDVPMPGSDMTGLRIVHEVLATTDDTDAGGDREVEQRRARQNHYAQADARKVIGALLSAKPLTTRQLRDLFADKTGAGVRRIEAATKLLEEGLDGRRLVNQGTANRAAWALVSGSEGGT